MITIYRSAIPVWLEALSANQSDKQSFVATIQAYTQQLEGSEPPYYVVDSALYSEENLQALSEIRWITRVPETLKEAKQLLGSVAPEEMESLGVGVGEGYASYEHRSDYGGVEQRRLAVFSEQAYEREMTTFQRRLERQGDEAAKELRALSRRRFACEVDARAAVAAVEREWRYHRAQVAIEPIQKYRRRSRPRAGEERQIVGYRVKGRVVEDEGAIAEATRTKGRFIMATNELNAEALPAGEILVVYKAQGVSVERGFRFLRRIRSSLWRAYF